MGNAVAHLPRADDADPSDFHVRPSSEFVAEPYAAVQQGRKGEGPVKFASNPAFSDLGNTCLRTLVVG